MNCPKCGFGNRKDAYFCGNCGARLSKICPQCEAGNPLENLFCDRCGLDLGGPREFPITDSESPRAYTPKSLAEKILNTRSFIEGERKFVTVLFADVANYTSMSEKLDPEEVHRIMGGCFKILLDEVHRYEGTIDKFTGDGVMALFGAPVGHEDHAQRACYAALSGRNAISEYGDRILEERGVEFKIRIGINSGTVIVGSVGDDLKMDYTVIGDTTNLASRMETIARPGTILVSSQTYRLAKGFFAFRSLGRISVKGKEASQEVYELIRAGEAETRIEAAEARGLTRFVGREKEMEALEEALCAVRSGSGRTVGIVGDAGVGKSRLLLEFSNGLSGDATTFLAGRCLHYGNSMLYVPILDILKGYFDIREGEPDPSVNRKVQDRLELLDRKLLTGLPSLQDLLSLEVEDEAYLQIDPQQRRQMTFEAIRSLLIRASREKPLILAIEDLHWIDRISQEFLDFFAAGIAEAPVLLLLLYRPEYRRLRGDRAEPFEIPLDQLSTRRAAELVNAILHGGRVLPEARDLVLDRAGGNPLFVEELTLSLLENGSIRFESGQYGLSRNASEIEVPDTIQGIIAARMDRVDEHLKRIMQYASVIGRAFPFRILQKMIGEREELEESLRNLQDLEFVYERERCPELSYIFKHAVTQEVAYSSLLLTRRKEIHEEAGQAIEDLYPQSLDEFYELLAYHYVRSGNRAGAVKYLDLANQKAVKVYAMEDAMARFEKAMELLDALPDTEENRERRISLLVNQHLVFFFLLKSRQYHELLVPYTSMAETLKDQGLLGAFYTRLGACKFALGHPGESLEAFTRASKLCESEGNTEEAGLAYFQAAMAHFWRGDYQRVLDSKQDVLRMVKRRFNLRNYVRAMCISSWACAEMGRFEEAIELGSEGLAKARQYADKGLISWSEWTVSVAHTHRGDLDRALECAERAVGEAPTSGDKAFAQGFLAWIWCRAGEPLRGIESLKGLLALYRAAGFVSTELFVLQFLAEAYLLTGDHVEARDTAEELLNLAERCNAKAFRGQARRLLGETAQRVDPDAAVPYFEESIAIFRGLKAENALAHAYGGLGRVHKKRGNPEQAGEYLTKALDVFERLGTLLEPDRLRKELAEL